MRAADLLVQTLKSAGVSRIFSLSGNQIMPVYDACFAAGMPIVHTRHEAAALYMAEAHAQLTGEVGVALVTAGAGAANAMGPLLTTMQSETPVLLLTGDSPLGQDGTGAFQEMDQLGMSRALTKLSLRPRDPARLGHDVALALRCAASGRPGPVHISLPFDLVQQDAGDAATPDAGSCARETLSLGCMAVDEITAALSKARAPVVICGPAMNTTRTGNLMARLAAAQDVPVFAMESPRGLNDPSLGALAEVFADADLILSLGKRIDFTTGFGQAKPFGNAVWISVQADVAERDRARRNLGSRLAASHAADPRDAAEALIAAGQSATARHDWREATERRLKIRRAESGTGTGISETITSARLCAAVQTLIAPHDDAVFIGDGGEFGQWAQAGITAPARMINGVSGAIGGGICYGLAAALARPGAPVLALMGDGTVGFHLAEFETAARVGAGFVTVIGNDRRWNAEHQIQLRDYGEARLIGCELSGARYDLAAAALGCHGEYVTDAGDLDAALARALDHARAGTPACVNVEIEGAPAPAAPAH